MSEEIVEPTPTEEEVIAGEETGTAPVEDGGEVIEDTPPSEEETHGKIDPKIQAKINARIAKLTSEKYELAEKLKRAESEKTITPAQDQPVIPNLDDFDTTEEYTAAMAKYSNDLFEYKLNQRETRTTEESRQRAEVERIEKSTIAFEEKASKFKEQHKDFEEVAKSSNAVMIYNSNPSLAVMIQESDFGPELAYHFGSNLAVLDEIASMSLEKAAREIGRLEAKIESGKNITPRAVSKAPTPITPVGGGQAVIDKDPADMTDDEFFEYRRRIKANRK